MKNSLRSIAIVSVFALIAAIPTKLHAERTGCNPHPQAIVALPGVLQIIADTVISYLSY
jgi:hypothetical protein